MEKSTTQNTSEGWLTRDCVIKAGEKGPVVGRKGDKVSKDGVGPENWEKLAVAGAVSKTPIKADPKPKPEGKSKD